MSLIAEPVNIVPPVPARRRPGPDPFSKPQVLSTLRALSAWHVETGDRRSYNMLRYHTCRLWPYVAPGASESACITAMGRLIARAWEARDAEAERERVVRNITQEVRADSGDCFAGAPF